MKRPYSDKGVVEAKFRAGFTLVEMLVAFAVGALLLVSLATVVSSSMRVSRKSNSSLIAYNSAAAALDLIGSDLESLAVTRQPFEYLQIASTNVVTGGSNTAKLMLLTVSPNDYITSSDAGQVRAVMYQLANQDVLKAGGGNKIYGLYRFSETNAGNVFTNYLGQGDLSTNTSKGYPSSAAISDFLAGNVVDFQVRLYSQGNQTSINPNPTDVVRLSGSGITKNGTNITGGVATAEVTLRVLDDTGAQLLKNGRPLTNVWSQYGHVLTRKVLLRSPQ